MALCLAVYWGVADMKYTLVAKRQVFVYNVQQAGVGLYAGWTKTGLRETYFDHQSMEQKLGWSEAASS